jgi:hypothetical protein
MVACPPVLTELVLGLELDVVGVELDVLLQAATTRAAAVRATAGYKTRLREFDRDSDTRMPMAASRLRCG